MKFVYPFIIFTALTHPYEKTVPKLQLEEALIKIRLFAIPIYGGTPGSEFASTTCFLVKIKFMIKFHSYEFLAVAIFYLKTAYFS